MAQSKFPQGWDKERVRSALKHYEEQTEEEVVAEDEAGFENQTESTVQIPVELLPAFRELIAKHEH